MGMIRLEIRKLRTLKSEVSEVVSGWDIGVEADYLVGGCDELPRELHHSLGEIKNASVLLIGIDVKLLSLCNPHKRNQRHRW